MAFGAREIRWEDVLRELWGRPFCEELAIPSSSVPHPIDVGALKSVGRHAGEHYRLGLRDGMCLHVRVVEDYYHAHIDRFDPAVDLLGHTFADNPDCGVLLVVGSVALAGLAADGKRGLAIGALVGVAVAILFYSLPPPYRTPREKHAFMRVCRAKGAGESLGTITS